MRISERKRRLRDHGTSPIQQTRPASGSERAEPKPRASSSVPAKRAAREASTRTTVAPSSRRQPRTRGPRFYAGFGIVGLVFSAILAETTYANYQTATNKYPAALSQYRNLLAQYKVALAKYQAAHGVHLSRPKLPVAPEHPVLSAGSFLLPLLYATLSIAYLFLAYRAVKKKRMQV